MSKLRLDIASWSDLERLLDEALDRPAAARAAWLDSLDSQFEALKPQLRALLARAAEVETSDFLATLPSVALEATPATDESGRTIGAYRLVRELGRGGMGSVWLAERVDGLIDRPVALKLPHVIAHSGLAERMARERAILAALNHPHIARLYDAGLGDDGQPYLALEYVEGRPLDVHCRSGDNGQPLDLRARLRLFLQVVNAVAYAHGKLIIHRDLKPANILVTAEGEVRLLDFGIAKLLEDGVAHDSALTELGPRALTPDYASPEQIRGEPLTVAADVYALGVLLYELLTDRLPYPRKSRSELEHAILNIEPSPPLRGDVDTIALKALKKRPEERYATANALAEDVARYLDGRPVLARPDSASYRLMKFVGRHKVGVASAAAALIAVLAGAAVSALAGTRGDRGEGACSGGRALRRLHLPGSRPVSAGRTGAHRSGAVATRAQRHCRALRESQRSAREPARLGRHGTDESRRPACRRILRAAGCGGRDAALRPGTH